MRMFREKEKHIMDHGPLHKPNMVVMYIGSEVQFTTEMKYIEI